MRLDKYIWSVRLFKTRSLAAKACGSEKVKLNGQLAKASKEIKVGDTLEIRVTPIWRSFEILDIPKSRVGAKLVPDLINELTPEEKLEELEQIRRLNRQNKQFGIKGRPTKKNRRDIGGFLDA